MRTKHQITIWFLLLLATITILVFWPLYAGQFTLRGDATDILIPVFSHIREALSQGDWPLWNNYQQQGFATSIHPIYWNPLYLILGALFSSPDYALNAAYLTSILLGGLGFYKFSDLILKDHRLAILGGVCYPLVGFFVAQGQYIDLVSAASWIPLLLYILLKYLDKGEVHHLFYLAIGYYLFTTSTSQGFVLVFTAIMVSILLYKYFGQAISINRSIYASLTTFAAGFLVWRIYWIRWTSYDSISRDGWKKTPFYDSLQDLSSLLLSRSTTVTSQSLDGMATVNFHSFVGTLILLLAILSVIIFRTKTDLKLAISGLIFLLLSMITTILEGSGSVVSGIYSMPVTATMKILMAGSLLILGLRGLKKVSTEAKKYRIIIAITGLLLIGLAYLLEKTFTPGTTHDTLSWFLQLDILKSAIFISCIIAVLWIPSPKLRLYLIGGLIIIELGLSNYLNQDSTLYNEYPSSVFSPEISNPENMPKSVDLTNPIGLYSDQDFKIASLKRNTGTLFKRIVQDGYWPWETKLHHKNLTSENWKRQLRYPLFYFSRDTSLQAKPSFTNFNDPIIVRSQSDHKWDLSLITRYEKYLIFNQNFDKNWKAFVDTEQIPVAETGTGMMKIPISPGLHTVSFVYYTDGLFNIFGFTMIVMTLLIILMAVNGSFPLPALLVCFPIIFLLVGSLGNKTLNNRLPHKSELPQDTSVFKFGYEGHAPFWFIRSWQITPDNSFTGYRSESLNHENEYSATLQIHRQALNNKKELEYEFHYYAEEPINAGIVIKTYTEEDDSYNIKYFTSLNTGQWKTIKGRFSLEELKGPLVKADVYIWNYQKKDFLIDDIKIKLIP